MVSYGNDGPVDISTDAFDVTEVEYSGGCLACELITYLETEHLPMLLGNPVVEDVKAQLRALSDPELHTFADNCRFDLPGTYSKDDILDLEYEIEFTQRPGVLGVNICVLDDNELEEFEVTVEV